MKPYLACSQCSIPALAVPQAWLPSLPPPSAWQKQLQPSAAQAHCCAPSDAEAVQQTAVLHSPWQQWQPLLQLQPPAAPAISIITWNRAAQLLEDSYC